MHVVGAAGQQPPRPSRSQGRPARQHPKQQGRQASSRQGGKAGRPHAPLQQREKELGQRKNASAYEEAALSSTSGGGGAAPAAAPPAGTYWAERAAQAAVAGVGAGSSSGGPRAAPSPPLRTPLHRKPEVLAPAGGWPQLRAAVENGADAVYFGLSDFNARARASNFGAEELPGIMRYLHDRGVRGYVVLNVLGALC